MLSGLFGSEKGFSSKMNFCSRARNSGDFFWVEDISAVGFEPLLTFEIEKA